MIRFVRVTLLGAAIALLLGQAVSEPAEPGAGEIERLRLDVYFVDQDECIVSVDERSAVLKIRNGGNLNFEERK